MSETIDYDQVVRREERSYSKELFQKREALEKEMAFEWHYGELYGYNIAWPRIQAIVDELDEIDALMNIEDRRLETYDYDREEKALMWYALTNLENNDDGHKYWQR